MKQFYSSNQPFNHLYSAKVTMNLIMVIIVSISVLVNMMVQATPVEYLRLNVRVYRKDGAAWPRRKQRDFWNYLALDPPLDSETWSDLACTTLKQGPYELAGMYQFVFESTIFFREGSDVPCNLSEEPTNIGMVMDFIDFNVADAEEMNEYEVDFTVYPSGPPPENENDRIKKSGNRDADDQEELTDEFKVAFKEHVVKLASDPAMPYERTLEVEFHQNDIMENCGIDGQDWCGPPVPENTPENSPDTDVVAEGSDATA